MDFETFKLIVSVILAGFVIGYFANRIRHFANIIRDSFW